MPEPDVGRVLALKNDPAFAVLIYQDVRAPGVSYLRFNLDKNSKMQYVELLVLCNNLKLN